MRYVLDTNAFSSAMGRDPSLMEFLGNMIFCDFVFQDTIDGWDQVKYLIINDNMVK